jgi:hypothetical protein
LVETMIGLFFLYSIFECIRKDLRSIAPSLRAEGVQVDPCVVVILKKHAVVKVFILWS